MLAGGLLLLNQYVDITARHEQLMGWFQEIGWWGHAGFIMLLVLVIVCMIPNTPLQLGAGIIFPFPLAVLYVLLAESTGAVIAMLIGRYGLLPSWREKLRDRKLFRQISRILTKKGWRSILATRLIPIFPFKTSNYVYGLTDVHSSQLWIGTFLGTAPRTTIVVYLGTLISDLADLQKGSPANPLLQGIILGIAILLGLAGAGYLWVTSKNDDAVAET